MYVWVQYCVLSGVWQVWRHISLYAYITFKYVSHCTPDGGGERYAFSECAWGTTLWR